MAKAWDMKVPVTTKKGNITVIERLRHLDRTEKCAVLATIHNSQPYTSFINFAFTPDYSMLIFATPRKTSKYRNILKNTNIAILIDNRSKISENFMDVEAVTILGTAQPVKRGNRWEDFVKIYTAKHPLLEGFVSSPATALIVVKIMRCIHVSKFQTISIWDTQA